MDIDDLLNEINNASSTEQAKSKKKKKKQNEVNTSNLNTAQIVQTFEAIQLGDPKKRDENIKNALDNTKEELDETSVVKDLNAIPITTDNVVDLIEADKKKKKKKKKKKAGDKKDDVEEIGDESKVATDLEKVTNNYRHLFDFSGQNITNSRFQDNSCFRVLKNWEDIPWHQT